MNTNNSADLLILSLGKVIKETKMDEFEELKKSVKDIENKIKEIIN